MEFPNSAGSNWDGSISSGSESESDSSSMRTLRDIVIVAGKPPYSVSNVQRFKVRDVRTE